jgi:hypothetical protein
LLGYVAGQYRLQTLGRSIFPWDNPLEATVGLKSARGKRSFGVAEQPRSGLTVTPQEVALLAASLPIWALAAQLAWLWLAQPRELFDWDPRVVQAAIYSTTLVGGMTLVATLLKHFRRRQMTSEEAALLLQDTFWNETRGELRWFARWLAWFSLKRKGYS